jgi:2-polyprenyl-3-methyl-5-hydroxy-6-metoxy-1,4-benzoquinol methylase
VNSDAGLLSPVVYWDERARRFASQGDGLGAVCSYGMPTFHNRSIHLCQYLALRPWLRPLPGTRVLDAGCGVGRWSHLLAARGACVTGVDHSPVMIAEATRRASGARHSTRCRFLVQDLAELDAGEEFDLILSVTVLQHVLEPAALRTAVERLAQHLSPTGTLLLLEAAPRRRTQSCDSAVFRARERSSYLELFAQCGLTLRTMRGVDPAPFRPWLLPHMRSLPRPLGLTALALTTALSLPIDILFGRRAVGASWHALFVLGRARDRHAH